MKIFLTATAFAGCAGAESGSVRLEGIPELQQWAFEDGEITFDEYRSAVVDVVNCIRDAGFTVEGPHPMRNDPQSLSYTTAAEPGEQLELTDAQVALCESEYLSSISMAWAEANYDEAAREADDRFYADTVDCVAQSSGEDLSDVDPQSSSDLRRVISDFGDLYHDCMDLVASEAQESGISP